MSVSDDTAKRLLKMGFMMVGLLGVMAIGGLVWKLPASEQRDGMLGVGAALAVLAAGFTGIYRFARMIERQEARQMAKESARR